MLDGKKRGSGGRNTNGCEPMIRDRGLAWTTLDVVTAFLEQSARAGVKSVQWGALSVPHLRFGIKRVHC